MIRTNAPEASEEELWHEWDRLVAVYNKIMTSYKSRTYGTLLKKGVPAYLAPLRDSYNLSYKEIIVEGELLYEDVKSYLEQLRPSMLHGLNFYKEDGLKLQSLYNMKAEFQTILGKRVWLKSGASLVIEQTEAMVVVDVNTSKATDTKKTKKGFLDCNLEAAKELVRQIRLRSLSGNIMVDFIDMKTSEENETLLRTLQQYADQEQIKTTVLGMTRLHLVEMTRQKKKKNMYEE